MKSQIEHFRGRLAGGAPGKYGASIAVASGKGGVGKSSLSLNLAASLSKLGARVLLVDGDAGLPDLDILLGVRPNLHWGNFISGEKSLEEIIVKDCHGVDCIFGFSGIPQQSWTGQDSLDEVVEGLASLSHKYDFRIIDVGAGLGDAAMTFCTAVDRVLLLLNGELTSLADAYGTLKTIRKKNPEQFLSIVVNNATNEKEANQAYSSLLEISQRFLNLSPDLEGIIPRDSGVPRSVAKQKPIVVENPGCDYSRAIQNLAQKIFHWNHNSPNLTQEVR